MLWLVEAASGHQAVVLLTKCRLQITCRCERTFKCLTNAAEFQTRVQFGSTCLGRCESEADQLQDSGIVKVVLNLSADDTHNTLTVQETVFISDSYNYARLFTNYDLHVST